MAQVWPPRAEVCATHAPHYLAFHAMQSHAYHHIAQDGGGQAACRDAAAKKRSVPAPDGHQERCHGLRPHDEALARRRQRARALPCKLEQPARAGGRAQRGRLRSGRARLAPPGLSDVLPHLFSTQQRAGPAPQLLPCAAGLPALGPRSHHYRKGAAWIPHPPVACIPLACSPPLPRGHSLTAAPLRPLCRLSGRPAPKPTLACAAAR